MKELKFGYLPESLDITIADISISSLDNIQESMKSVQNEGSLIRNDWLYAPLAKTSHINFGSRKKAAIQEEPYSSRIFGLPQTHIIKHNKSDCTEHLDFLIWCLGFFKGIRLTTTEAGFLDATPIKIGKLVDFNLGGKDSEKKVLDIAEKFWQKNKNNKIFSKRITAIIHALFISHYPKSLCYEKFMHLYQALDCCYSVVSCLKTAEAKTHAQRIELMCNIYNLKIPDWAKIQKKKGSSISRIRNDTFHEALFFGEPLGFSIFEEDDTSNINTILELQNLISRLLVGIIIDGQNSNSYVTSPVKTRNRFGLNLC